MIRKKRQKITSIIEWKRMVNSDTNTNMYVQLILKKKRQLTGARSTE